jgi:hypothetical protein
MFSTMTEQALALNLASEAGAAGLVTMTAEVYRELVGAARAWDALRSGAMAPMWNPINWRQVAERDEAGLDRG